MEGLLPHGGPAELGVWLAKMVLIVFSIASVAVMIERALTLRRIKMVEERDYRALKDAILRRQMEAVRAYLAASPAPCAAALQSGFSFQGASPETVREAIAQEVDVQNASLHGTLPFLASVASTAPYVGLFGTVLGILHAFSEIARTNQTGAKVVAGPIAEALITTALGLGVAIPAVMAYNYFSTKVNALSLQVETHSLELAARLPNLDPVMGGDHEG